jgi:fluoride exporter
MRLVDAVLVGAGGACGSIARYLVSLALASLGAFPYGTLAVNVTGCFVAGALVGLGDGRGLATPARLLLVTGFLGGYTTFSAFGVETIRLAESHGPLVAGANVLVGLGLGLGAAAAGLVVGRGL